MVRRAERALGDETGRGIEDAGDGVDLRCLEGFFKGKGSEGGRQALGQHRFAGTGRADHENVVAACSGDFEGALCGLLAADVFKVDGELLKLTQDVSSVFTSKGSRETLPIRVELSRSMTSSREATG